VRAQAASAQHIADALSEDGKLRVIYPGLQDHPQHALTQAQMGSGGTVMAIDAGSKDAAFALLNRLEIFTISNNLGDAKSIVTHPATTTHQRLDAETKKALGITPGLIRCSIGLEDRDDLLGDLRDAIG
jgi:O-succinylhomoserine sulfhydrylase